MNQYRIQNFSANNFVGIDNRLSKSSKFVDRFEPRSSIEVIEQTERTGVFDNALSGENA